MTGRSRWILNAIIVLAFIGIVVSSVSLYHHYDKTGSSFCDFGGKFNCDIVNRSIYSAVYDVPVALIGILGYAAVAGLARFCSKKAQGKTFLLLAALGGLAFALRLTYIEGFVLAAWCVLCLSSLALIFFITVLSAIFVVSPKQTV